MKNFKYFDLLMAIFVTSILISNIASSAKIIDLNSSLFGLPLMFDAGTLLFPITYIFGDILTEVYGFRKSRRVIWTGFGCAALMSLTLMLVRLLPGESEWQQYAGEDAFMAILGGVSSGGIVIASLIAYLIGEYTNSVILARIKVMMEGRMLWIRTIGSTLVGELIDTGLFVSIACLFGVFPWQIAASLILANYLFKVSVEVLFTPVTYLVVHFLKKSEHEDYYDTNTQFKLFGFGN